MMAVAVNRWVSQFKVHFLGKSLEQGPENCTEVSPVYQEGLIFTSDVWMGAVMDLKW